MMTRPARLLIPVALTLFYQVLVVAKESKLEPGVQLPLLEAKTLIGDPAALPRDANGHPALLIVGFTKAASKVARVWLENCLSAVASRPGGSGVLCYDVRMVEDVPKLFRGMMEKSMRSGYPTELQRQAFLVYGDNEAWRGRVGVTDDKTAYVIGCDKEGRVRGTANGEFAKPELQSLLEAIDPTTQSKVDHP